MKTMLSTLIVIGLVAGASAEIYMSDFEADDGGLVGTGDWEWGSPNGFADAPFGDPEPIGGNSGNNAWGTVIGGAHNPSTVSTLTLNVDLSGTDAAELSYYEWLDSGSNTFDTARTLVNGDELLLADGGPTANWRLVTLDLANYVGQSSVDIVWEFSTTSVVERVGWYIDDVVVTPEPGTLALLGLGALALIRRR